MQLKTKTKIKPPVEKSVDDLLLKKKGGGSIIKHRPLFASNGETLYTVCTKTIRAYSTQTGDLVKEFEPADNKIINIVLSPEYPDTIIGCTENAELIYWDCHNGSITIKTKLTVLDDSNSKIKTFHLIKYTTYKQDYVCNAVLSSIVKRETNQSLLIELFDLKLGSKTLCKEIQDFEEEYYIDTISNYGENLLAIANNFHLYILRPIHGLKFNRHKTGRKVTCISGHPEQECLATGDASGRILIWKGLSQYNPVRAMYHWHTLPVTDIVFSSSGTHMYSGGGECVLVKWSISNPSNKSFLPRLPAPIKYLVIAPENTYVAVSTLDNGILIVNPQRKINSAIQNFTWGFASSPKNLFPAGLTLDPRTNSLVLNSRTGHIQFYNVDSKCLLYNLNITGKNFLTEERHEIIVNTEVCRIANNSDGNWMATIEEKTDNLSSIEVRLKFWNFDTEKHSFALNTSVELPHEIGVNTLKFKPKVSLGDENQFAVTVGKDKRFKLWHLSEVEDVNQIKRYWRCYSVGYYQNLSALDAGFSFDGSIVAVSFESTLTLWNTETSDLKKCLSHSSYRQPIIRVEFGKFDQCHLIVTASKEYLAIWDLLSLTIKWSVPINTAILSADSLSNFIAVFTTNNSLVVFTPDNSHPVYIRKNVIEDNSVVVLGACFIPNHTNSNESTSEWQRKSQLYFINSDQELLTLEPKSKANKAMENLSASINLPLTAFNRIIAAERVTNVEKQSSTLYDYTRVLNKGVVDELLSVPAHTLPPMRMLCMPFILSLTAQSRNLEVKTPTLRKMDDYHLGLENSNLKQETNGSGLKNDEESFTFNCKNNKESKELEKVDWSFLLDVLPSSDSIN